MDSNTLNVFKIMDEAEDNLLRGKVDEALTDLTVSLQEYRSYAKPDVWWNFKIHHVLNHSLVPLIHQDPVTKHSFIKPRGYPGDAELLDYMYGLRAPAAETTKLGKQIFHWGSKRPTTNCIRERRKIIALTIDELAEDSSDLRILSIACGHLREAKSSRAVTCGRIAEYFALDQDAVSLEVVKNELSEFNVIPINAPIKSLFTDGQQFHNLDFVYAAGLYDYLSRRLAVKLTSKIFKMLKPSGRLLIANFAPCLPDIAYGETFLRWNLIYRNETEVLDFASEIDQREISDQKIFRDQTKNVIYLEIV